MSKVYFTKDITPKSLAEIYEKLSGEKPLKGKIGVKISTGENGGHNYLKPELIGDLVKQLGGVIVECNTAYGGNRQDTKDHRATIHAHGFDQIATVDIMDEDGELDIPTRDGAKHLDHDTIGLNAKNYDGLLMLSDRKSVV